MRFDSFARLPGPRRRARQLCCAVLLVALPATGLRGAEESTAYSRWPRPSAPAARKAEVRLMTAAEVVPAPLPKEDMTISPSPSDLPPDADGMPLDSMVQIALANNPTIRQSSAALEAARGNWVQVGLYPNPGVAYLGNQIGDQGRAGQQGGYFEQEIVRGGKLQLNREVAEREILIAQQNLAAQRQRVINDVRIQFYNTLVAQRAVEITHDLRTTGQRALEVANSLFDAQQVSKVDVLQARIEANSAGIGVVNAENRLAGSWRRLAAVAAVPGMQQQKLTGDLLADMPTFTWEESVGRILQESPELAATRTQVARAVETLRRARVEPIPNVTLQAGPQYDAGTNHTITNVNVLVPVPLFNYNQGNIRRAEADVRAARAAVARQELVLTTKLAAAFERYDNARNQVHQFRREILPDARESLDLVAGTYKQGESSFLVLLTAQRTYFQTMLAYLDAQRELWETAIAIDGLMLTDSLQAGDMPNASMPSASGPGRMPLDPFMGR